ncbi:hypothetical protein ACROYT_G000407 [Oculina patagonica]
MQWIKHKKEERMAVAAKVLGAVRLGLVDIRVVIEELGTEEMQRVPEINMHLQESMMHSHMPSHNSKFAGEKTKPRLTGKVLVAIHPTVSLQPSAAKKDRISTVRSKDSYPPKTMVHYFDTETKIWTPMPSVVQLGEITKSCFSAEIVGNYMYLAAQCGDYGHSVYRYHIVNNTWETLPPFQNVSSQINCLCAVDDYIYAISEDNPPQRYSLANNDWQSSGAKLSFFKTSSYKVELSNVAAVVLKSKIYAIHGYQRNEREMRYDNWKAKAAVVHCFDPAKNEWEQKASTCQPHFGSSLFVVNDKLCVAGGKMSPYGYNNPAPVEIYNEENKTWSVDEQKHIPPNNLGAVEIEGRVYFIINKFPVDSGIRIPPGEVYHVSFNGWENLAKISSQAVLCYLPVKKENLKTEQDENQNKM